LPHGITAPAQTLRQQELSTVPQPPLLTTRVVNAMTVAVKPQPSARTAAIATHQSAIAWWHASMAHDDGHITAQERVQRVPTDTEQVARASYGLHRALHTYP
jgi:hypothetical protein